MENYNEQFKIILSKEEKIKCLEEILLKLKKVLYVYDKSNEAESKYNYKVYCGGILIYISSSNYLFDGDLINIIIGLNAIINENLDKTQIKRIVFDCRNEVQSLISRYNKELA